MEGIGSSIAVEELAPNIAEESAEQAIQDDENRSSSDDNSDSEMRDRGEPSEDAVKDDRRSYCSSQASADEASYSPLDSSSISSQSSESDIFIDEDQSPNELSDEDNNNNNNNNNHRGREIAFTDDSDDESSSSYEGTELLDESRRCKSRFRFFSNIANNQRQHSLWLKKELPKQNFSLIKEITNRQFQDNFKRKHRMKFENKMYSSSKMVQRLELFEMLEKHYGCVNSIFFNDSGELLVSASDDHHVCLWDWASNKSLLYFDTGHVANVFQAKFLPSTNDTHLITCGADSQIRMCSIDQSGLRNTSLIVKHEKTVHKIALQRQMPNTFLSAGEDGVVLSIDIRESSHFSQKLLKVVNARSKSNLPIFLYSIDCNPLKNYEFIVCGNDKDVRLYDQRMISRDNVEPVKTFCPASFNNRYLSRCLIPSEENRKCVTSAVFNYNGTEVLASYNDNTIYLFDSYTTEGVHHYDGHRNYASIKGVNFYGPRSEYIVSGSDCGYVYLWDKDSETIVQWMKGDEHIVHCAEPHPSFPVLATSGMDSDVKIWMPIGKGDLDVKKLDIFQKVTRRNVCYLNDGHFLTSNFSPTSH